MERKYVKDYEEMSGNLGKSKEKRQYRYIGDYYSYQHKTTKNKMLQEYTILFGLLCVCWIGAGLLNSQSSFFGMVGISYALMVLPMLYFARGLFCAWRIKEDRLERRWFDASAGRMKNSIIGLLVTGVLLLMGELIFLILNRASVEWGKELVFFAISTVIFLISLGMYAVNRQNPCQKEKNSVEA